jgi:outer membrane protein OmpA-like peptidoglycan-associated protein
MNDVGRVAALLILVSGLTGACGPKQVRTPQRPTGQAVVALLPDPDTGAVGRGTVSNPAGSVELAAARASTTVSAGQPPAPVTTLSEADVRRMFGAALAALPTSPRHFILYFRFESNELTDESRALVPQILQAVTQLPAAEVLVIGHTDRTGTNAANFALGLRRAEVVRTLLRNAGLNASSFDVTSHGETDLLVQTPDDRPEPRNRRVEITVR